MLNITGTLSDYSNLNNGMTTIFSSVTITDPNPADGLKSVAVSSSQSSDQFFRPLASGMPITYTFGGNTYGFSVLTLPNGRTAEEFVQIGGNNAIQLVNTADGFLLRPGSTSNNLNNFIPAADVADLLEQMIILNNNSSLTRGITVVVTDRDDTQATFQGGTAQPANTPPIVENPIPDRSAAEGDTFVLNLAQVFDDAETSDANLIFTQASSGDGRFNAMQTLSNGQLTISLDGVFGVFTLFVEARDEDGASVRDTFVLTVTDNEAPTVVTQDITVNLDATGNAAITALDVDNGSSDNVAIAALSVSPSSFNANNLGDNIVTLTVVDTSGNSATDTATVTVRDVTVPQIPAMQEYDYPENQAAGATLATVVATDNVGVTGFQILSGDPGDFFDISATGVITLTNTGAGEVANDFESGANEFMLQVEATDSSGNTASETVTLMVTNVDEEPEITTPPAVTIDENTTTVVDVESTDPDGQTEGMGLTYQITGGADQALFGINTVTGLLSFLSAPDAEMPLDAGGDNIYNVQVTVTDPTALTDVVDFVVTVDAVNEAPEITVPGPQVVDEDDSILFSAGEGTAIAVADPDADTGDLVTMLSVNNGVLQVAATSATVEGQDTGDVTITGTLAETAAALSAVIYSPDADFNGADTLIVEVDDGGNSGTGGPLQDSSTVPITINPVQDDPVAVLDEITIATPPSGQPQPGPLPPTVIDALANDFDVDGDMLSIVSIDTGLTDGIATLGPGAPDTISYVPVVLPGAPDAPLVDTVLYTLSDGNGNEVEGRVVITLEAMPGPADPGPPDVPNPGGDDGTGGDGDENADPDARDDLFARSALVAVSGSVLTDNGNGADSDPDGDALSLTSLAGAAPGTTVLLPSGATVAANVNGSFAYDPGEAFADAAPGSEVGDSFSYTIEDGQGGTANAQVTIQYTLPEDAIREEGTDGDDDFSVPDTQVRREIDGMEGEDSASLPGGVGDYLIDFIDGGFRFTPITTAGGGEGASQDLLSIETIAFEDATLRLVSDGDTTKLALIYDVAFNRFGDFTGVTYWNQILANGTAIEAIAEAFADSEEFVLLNGANTEAGLFFDILYFNSFGRIADGPGRAFWVDELTSGVVTRGEAIILFACSDEAAELNANAIDDGVLLLV